MLKPVTVVLAAALAGAAAAPFAWANDSTAELATGGLVFVRNDNVEMRSEDLTICPRPFHLRSPKTFRDLSANGNPRPFLCGALAPSLALGL